MKLVRFLGAGILLLLLAWFIDIDKAVAQLRQTDARWLIPACVVIQIQVVLSALRWQITAKRLGQPLTTGRAISEYYLATVGNLSLPGGVTGDAARVYRNRQSQSLSVSVHSVMIERLAGQLALLVVSIVGWLLWPLMKQGSAPELGWQIPGVTVIFLVLVALSISLIIRLGPEWIIRPITDFWPSLYTAWFSDMQWIVQSALSLLIVMSYLLVFLFSSYAVQAPLSIPATMTLVPLVLLSMLIPMSVGGWGVREASAAILWPFAGLSSEAGIATSVVYALISLIACLPGLLLLMRRHLNISAK